MSASAKDHRKAFSLALQFLTILPNWAPREFDARVQGLSLFWYPAVGLLLGLLLALAIELLPVPFYVQAAVVVALWVVLTGGLHLDGLADCADAWVGGLGDTERTLVLLKDPLVGSMGVLALVLLLLVKVAALAAIIESTGASALWVVPFVARAALLVLFLSTRYVRPGGLGEVLMEHFSRTAAQRCLAVCVLLLFLVLPFSQWLLMLVVTGVIVFLVRRATLRRLEGFTGDVAGAQVELVETGLLLLLVIFGA